MLRHLRVLFGFLVIVACALTPDIAHAVGYSVKDGFAAFGVGGELFTVAAGEETMTLSRTTGDERTAVVEAAPSASDARVLAVDVRTAQVIYADGDMPR